ncbi:hypothetical protein [Brevibacillus laterosporus]|uniref:hypothetical protein n=1 Tax=Brevibacillus laterosporus TaxID=1465 RepID=UPI00030A9DCB|nr:hypothetical protein [Brevibacillus laterosporus]
MNGFQKGYKATCGKTIETTAIFMGTACFSNVSLRKKGQRTEFDYFCTLTR